MKTNCIYQGDCLEFLKTFPDKSVDSVITDPPFGINFKYGKNKDVAVNSDDYWKWFEPIFKEIKRVTKDGGFIAIWQTQIYFSNFWKWFGKDIHIYCAAKNFVQLRKTAINFGYDPVIMFYKEGTPLKPDKPKRNLDYFVANTALFITQTNSLARRHPCPRPIDQVKEIINNFSIGTVLDPFLGSGTTALACKQLGRKYIGIEISPKYIKIAEQRLAQQMLF